MAVYVAGYCLGRFWIEGLRIDEADELGGLRWNQWVALAAGLLAVAYLVIDWAMHRPDPFVEDAGDVEISLPDESQTDV